MHTQNLRFAPEAPSRRQDRREWYRATQTFPTPSDAPESTPGATTGIPGPAGQAPARPAPAVPLHPPSPEGHTEFIYEHKSGNEVGQGFTDDSGVVAEQAENRLAPQLLGERLERFADRHRRALVMSDWLADLPPVAPVPHLAARLKRSGQLHACGSLLHFRHHLDADEVRLHRAHLCQLYKLCPLCAVRRGAKMLRRHAERADHVIREHAGGLVGSLVTFTVLNGPDLVERFDHLLGAFGKLGQDARDHRKGWCQDHNAGRGPALARLAGGVASVELKRGSGSGLWHPHIHVAVLHRPGLDRDELKRDLVAEWFAATGDSQVIDVRPFHHELRGELPTVENLAGDFAEVFKYAVKLNELTPADCWDAYRLTPGRRFVRSFGCMFGVELPDDLLDAPLADGDLAYVDLIYAYAAGPARYRLVRSSPSPDLADLAPPDPAAGDVADSAIPF